MSSTTKRWMGIVFLVLVVTFFSLLFIESVDEDLTGSVTVGTKDDPLDVKLSLREKAVYILGVVILLLLAVYLFILHPKEQKHL